MIIADFERKIDFMLSQMVSSTSASMASAVGAVAAGGIAIYFVFMSYAIIRGDIQDPMSKITKEVFGMAIIAAIATSLGAYQSIVVGTAQAVLGLLTSAVTQSSATTIGEAMDLLWTTTVVLKDTGEKVPMSSALWIIASAHPYYPLGIPDLLYFLAAVIVWFAMAALCIMCILPAFLAKIGFTLMLAIGPLFIFLAIIPYTRNYFASWLSNMLGNLMTLVLVALITTATANMFKVTMTDQLQNLSYEASRPLDISLVLFIISFGLGLVSLSASQLGAQLAGGGMALDTKGLAGAIVQAGLINKKNPGKGNASGDDGDANKMQSSKSYNIGQKLGRIFR